MTGRLLPALRRPSERPLLRRLAWSPVTLLDGALGALTCVGLTYGADTSVRVAVMSAGAVLGALGGIAGELRRRDNPAFDRFVEQRGFELWERRRTVWRPWRRSRPGDSLVVPAGWQEAADDLVTSLRKTLGGTVALAAVANGRIGGHTSLVAVAAAGDAMQALVWLDVRRLEGEIVVAPPPGLELLRPARREVHLEPPVVPRGSVAYASAGVAEAEVEAVLRPLDLPSRPQARLGLRIASEGVLVTLQRDLAEAVGVDELAAVAAEVGQTLKRTLITSPSATT